VPPRPSGLGTPSVQEVSDRRRPQTRSLPLFGQGPGQWRLGPCLRRKGSQVLKQKQARRRQSARPVRLVAASSKNMVDGRVERHRQPDPVPQIGRSERSGRHLQDDGFYQLQPYSPWQVWWLRRSVSPGRSLVVPVAAPSLRPSSRAGTDAQGSATNAKGTDRACSAAGAVRQAQASSGLSGAASAPSVRMPNVSPATASAPARLDDMLGGGMG
jgi:hypothetical protein